MKRTAMSTALIVMAICSLFTVFLAQISVHAGAPLKTSLSQEEVAFVRDTLFQGIPIYPNSRLDDELAAYTPGSFSMLGYLIDNTSKYTVSRFYVREMRDRGWRLIDSWGYKNKKISRESSATLTFRKDGQILTVDLAYQSKHRLQYSLFTYNLDSF